MTKEGELMDEISIKTTSNYNIVARISDNGAQGQGVTIGLRGFCTDGDIPLISFEESNGELLLFKSSYLDRCGVREIDRDVISDSVFTFSLDSQKKQKKTEE